MHQTSLYLDYNATSPLSPSVQDWLKSGEVHFANPASQHSAGKAARKSVNDARKIIYQSFNTSEKENRLFFHSGATEGLVGITYSFSELARRQKRPLLICYSVLDHAAVVNLKERYWGEHVDFFELKRAGDLTYDHEDNLRSLKALKAENPLLIILYHHLWVHNETGLVSSLEEIAPFKEIEDLYLHVDAVQAPGKIAAWRDLVAGDVWTYSAHKFGALKGQGFSILRENLPFYPLLSGGGQQQGFRAGTENPLGVMTVALALKDLLTVDVASNEQRRLKLSAFISQELEGVGEVISHHSCCSNTIYFYLYRVPSDIALALFDLNGLMISAGSACSSGAAKDSAVLKQLKRLNEAKNGLRLSFDFQLTDEQLAEIKQRLLEVFARLKTR